MKTIPPSEDCPYEIRHGLASEFGETSDDYRADVYAVTYTTFEGGVPNYHFDSETVGDEKPIGTARFAIGYPHPVFEGSFMITNPRNGRRQLDVLFDRLWGLAFDQCQKVACVLCGSERFLVIGGDQGDDCSVFYNAAQRRFWGSYGSHFDMRILVPVEGRDGELPWQTYDLPNGHGPYCDECVQPWVTDGWVTVEES